ncbi:MAG: response regulator [Lachnospiraceae bacterium]|nr:response regulator [Lachnospiraceae bacterium]
MYYNISFDVAAILMLTVIAVVMKTVLYSETSGHRCVTRYLYAVIICAVIDIITAYTICYGYMVNDGLNLVLNSLYQYSSAVCVAFAMQTILNYYPSASKKSKMINNILIFILFGFITLNLFTGWMFRFRDGVYYHGNLFFVAYALSLAIIFHMLFVVMKNYHDMTGRISKIIVLFLFLPTIFTILQMILGDILLISFGEAFSVLIMLFALETPDYRKLMKTMKELEIAREEANVANNSKSDFLASMSHEIRTPINGILGMNTMILRDSNDPKILEYAENIRISGNSLLSIINDILDVTKIESGRMELRPDKYELFSIMNDCYQMNRMRAEENGLKLIFENDPGMPSGYFGDEVRIRQIMNNLLSNGVKYTKTGSVTLNVSFDADAKAETSGNGASGTLVISVTDTGVGIRKEDLENLFKRFSRLDELKNRHIEGTGLGLHITQQLVGMMNGSIDVESEYGRGSKFTVRIPQKVTDRMAMGDFNARLSERVSIDREKTKMFTAPGKRILVVDDGKVNIIVFKGLLRDTQMTVDSASSGAECLEMTKRTKYDIIFMDHLMPEMDGIETFHRIQNDRENINCDTPVVVLTANAIVGVRASYLAEGFVEYVSKPVNQKELIDVAERILKEQAEKETG